MNCLVFYFKKVLPLSEKHGDFMGICYTPLKSLFKNKIYCCQLELVASITADWALRTYMHTSTQNYYIIQKRIHVFPVGVTLLRLVPMVNLWPPGQKQAHLS